MILKPKHFLNLLLIFMCYQCASLSGVDTEVESKKYMIENLNVKSVKKEGGKGASVVIASLMDSLQQNILLSYNDFENQGTTDSLSIEERKALTEENYNQYIDSLKQTLLNEGTVNIKPDEAFLIDYLQPKQVIDTIFLANLYVETATRGVPVTFQYLVNKNDEIFFEFENQTSKTIQEIQIIEGAESRFNHVNLKKKEPIKGSFLIQSDNTLTVKVDKSGFFKSVIRMKIRKLPKAKPIIAKMINDTLIETQTIVEMVSDTVFTKINEKKYILSPRLDITNSNQIDFPIEINNIKNLIGWGYWIGLEKKDISKYQSLLEEDESSEPLISFIKSELNIIRKRTFLPNSKNSNVKFKFQKLVSDIPSLNTTENYGYFTCDSTFRNPKAKIYLSNISKLYDYDINLMLVAVNLEYSQLEVEKEFFIEVPRIKLSIVQ